MMKEFVEWNDKYNVNIEIIDRQHRELLSLTNELFNACTQGRDEANEFFKNAIRKSVEYVKTHFRTEQDLMIKYKYPQYKTHRQEHEIFIKKILEYVERYEKKKQFVPNHYVRFLREWLLKHIAVSDKQYESFFKKKGLH